MHLILRLDKKGVIHFCALQDANRLNLPFDLEPYQSEEDYQTLIFYSKGEIYTASDAFIEAGKRMGGIYKMAYVFKVIPKVLRDKLYYFIAKNRYRWFGKHDACPMVPKKWRERFLEP